MMAHTLGNTAPSKAMPKTGWSRGAVGERCQGRPCLAEKALALATISYTVRRLSASRQVLQRIDRLTVTPQLEMQCRLAVGVDAHGGDALTGVHHIALAYQ